LATSLWRHWVHHYTRHCEWKAKNKLKSCLRGRKPLWKEYKFENVSRVGFLYRK
jgi:hypothetical protein